MSENNKPTHRMVRVDLTNKEDENGYKVKRYTDLGALWTSPKGKALSGRIDALNMQILILPIEEKPESVEAE